MKIERVQYHELIRIIESGKSALLLGPRQTGKTTLISSLPADLYLNLILPKTRQRYERDPELLAAEVGAISPKNAKKPLVVLDEVQRVPALLDVAQDLIDRDAAQFVLTGSSARKLRRGGEINLLPGRVISLRLDPVTLLEHKEERPLEEYLYYGSLPEILLIKDPDRRERLLDSYVTTYLEEEVRSEAYVKKLGSFIRFLELAALESGNIVNMNRIGQDLGIAHTTVRSYFEILVDCLVAERVEPIYSGSSRRRLSRTPIYLFFDLGVRRVAAGEAAKLGATRLGQLFEQLVGLELIRQSRLQEGRSRVHFWRDLNGPEVDWVIAHTGGFTPVEVKWSEKPKASDARHLELFLDEYQDNDHGYVICRTPRPFTLTERVTALPYRQINRVFG